MPPLSFGVALGGEGEGEKQMTTQPESTIPKLSDTRRSGVLKWGLVGCALLSAVLIVALVVVGMRARSILGWALAKVEGQVTAACAPEVSDADKEAFRQAFGRFVESAKEGKTTPEEIRAFQKKTLEALSDGRVTRDELVALTAAASKASPKAP